MKKRVLVSVSNKSELLPLAQLLERRNYEIVSTGGTFRYLKENGLNPVEITEITGFPEILDGRVKTLHPLVYGGILAKRDNTSHMQTIKEQRINLFDMVIVNLYPFFNQLKKDLSFDNQLEFIDIGGPSMLRAAAKSFNDVLVITDIADYQHIEAILRKERQADSHFRKKLAAKVFNLTSAYDAAVAQWLLKDDMPPYLNLSYRKQTDLRYGENPHQKAAYYVNILEKGSFSNFLQLHGKELSFNNIRDMDLAWKVVQAFHVPACCAVKHSTPCGVALGKNIASAYEKTFQADPVSIFGGILAANGIVDLHTAEKIGNLFLEIVIAPDFSDDALELLRKKKNLRLIKITQALENAPEYISIDGGILVQTPDQLEQEEPYQVVTEKEPTPAQKQALLFAQKVVKYTKSNAIVIAEGTQTLGVGTGQTNRIWATEQALKSALEKPHTNLVLASDAFFPFSDVVETAAKAGVKAIIQPGGSIRDQDSIDACNALGLSMVFTNTRHFKH